MQNFNNVFKKHRVYFQLSQYCVKYVFNFKQKKPSIDHQLVFAAEKGELFERLRGI